LKSKTLNGQSRQQCRSCKREWYCKIKIIKEVAGCACFISTLDLALKQAIETNNPDLLGLEVEGIVEAGHMQNLL